MNITNPIQILLVEDEDFDVARVKNTVKLFASRIQIADIVSNGKAALEFIKSKPDKYDVVILDFQISGGLRGEELIQKIKEIDPHVQIIVITKMTINMTDLDFAGSLLKAGAFWYCTKYPGNIEEYIYQPTDFILSIFNAYEKGSFTGASSPKPGLFEIANNGTIFLDEVSELPLAAQVKLLRVLQEGEIEKIGRLKSVSVNVRIIAATHTELSKEVNEGRFREDLYYRLNVIPLDLVPLRERGDDILLLFDHFLAYFSSDLNIPVPEVDPKAKEILLNYKWPGNVRELRNVVQRLVLNSNGKITAREVSHPMILRNPPFKEEAASLKEFGNSRVLPLREMERIFRTNYFRYVRSISSSDSNAAEKLGLAPSNFFRMCKELGLKP